MGGGGGDHGGECDEDGGGGHGGEVDYQVVPDCKLVSTIMGINSRLQVKHLIMFQYYMFYMTLNVWIHIKLSYDWMHWCLDDL